MKRIVFATNNQHKLQEIRDILGSGYEVVSLKEIGCDVDIPETGNTLEENALQKAQYIYDLFCGFYRNLFCYCCCYWIHIFQFFLFDICNQPS